VLVVDDDETIRLLFRELLAGEGYAVDVAATIAEADARLAAAPFDLVITDKNLPDGFGLDLARRVLDGANNGGAPAVIAMSAFASVDSAVEAIQLNVADYFVKPIERLDAVLARIKRVLEHQQLRRHNRELVEELRRKNRELESLAVRDPLTGLFNHAFFQESLDKEIARSERHGHSFALVFIDVDKFKAVNDSLGHPRGDTVLRALAEALRGSTRRSDIGFRLREQDIAARYGGDEFVLILPQTDKNGAALKAEALRRFVEAADMGSGTPRQTISVGVADYPADGVTRDRLILAADTALYAAKSLGRNRIVTYSPGLATLSAEPNDGGLEAQQLLALDHAIQKHAFHFHFQPIVRAQSGEVFAYEGLCRPQDPAFPDPLALIHTAERAGRIGDLGRVLRAGVVASLPQLAPPLLLFVNLHPHELYDPRLAEVEPFMRPWTRRVVLEVTETAAIADYGRVNEILSKLKAQGFRIALDDLGSGYSGLNALALLAPDFVKLDIGLLQGISAPGRHARLLRHILDYANGEGVQVIAEGVETEGQREAVTRLGTPLLQGYFFGKPSATFAGVTSR
jgi:diguanylate cyclase (GGDEF)-like protein